MIDPKPVKMCVCSKMAFAEILASGVTSIEEAGDRFGCGQGCQSCLQYLERVFSTGETEFPILPPR